MSQSGIWEAALGAGFPARLERLAAIEAAAGRAVDPLLRLCAVAVLTEEDADRLRDRLRLSNAEHTRLAQCARLLVALHDYETPPREHELLQFLFLNGREAASDALALAQAESRAPPDDSDWRRAAHFVATTPAPSFPVTGADLIARGIAPGKTLGATLKSLQAKWIRAGFPRDPATIMRLVDEATKSEGSSQRE
jgi:poly(A) polymerase